MMKDAQILALLNWLVRTWLHAHSRAAPCSSVVVVVCSPPPISIEGWHSGSGLRLTNPAAHDVLSCCCFQLAVALLAAVGSLPNEGKGSCW
jgi:hypothetical protein